MLPKFIIAKLLIHKLGSSLLLIMQLIKKFSKTQRLKFVLYIPNISKMSGEIVTTVFCLYGRENCGMTTNYRQGLVFFLHNISHFLFY